MGDSSGSEEFYDAEDVTPLRGSKRSSLCKSIQSVTEIPDSVDKEKALPASTEDNTATPLTIPPAEETPEDDRTTVKNVVQGRRRFQELRRCMQTEEEDDDCIPDPSGLDHQTFALEHPFKIISHDTMSLPSMTSLGRIGRILGGVSESQSNIRDNATASASSKEPSTISDDPIASDSRNQTVLAMAEPDVIASTKANSLKHSRAPPAAIVAVSGAGSGAGAGAGAGGPVAPPRRKKRGKLHDTQSLWSADMEAEGEPEAEGDGDNVSARTAGAGADGGRLARPAAPPARPHLDALHAEAHHGPASAAPHPMALPSPASTIESLTREFQDSLELSLAASDRSSSASQPGHHSTLDIKQAVKGDYIVRPHDDARVRSGSGGGGGGGGGGAGGGAARTHSETRAVPATGHSSLGAATRRSASERGGGGAAGGSRRRSAGDEAQLALGERGGRGGALRTRTVSGHQLSDIEILEQVTVLNLDTGERVPLSVAEHKLPQCINPLSLHIMRLTSEYIGRPPDDDHARETDEESECVCAGEAEDEAKEIKRESADRQTTAIGRKTAKIKRFFGSTVKRTVHAARSLAQEVTHARHKEDVGEIADEVRGGHTIKLKASNSHKGPYDFDGCVRHVQEMGSAHCGAVWCCKFSVCGRLLATAGQDRLLRIWVARDAYHVFQEMRTKYNAEKQSSPTPSQESLPAPGAPPPSPEGGPPPGAAAPFRPEPFCVYSGHTSDLLDVSWSKNYFILSSSMDKTVRLWHISRGECLCCFQHIDFVTAIVFHPRDDRYFLSGSLDGKLRLWNIPDKKVAVWNEVDGKTKLITAANFCQSGKFAVVGTYDGRCIFYTTDELKYHTQLDVRSSRGKNSTGRKVSGIEPMPGDDKVLVTSNDSRIRLYDLRDLSLSCKYKGYVNVSSQIKASFSHDGKYIVSGSENQCIYIWKTHHDYGKFTSVRRDRNDYWEGIKAHGALVTCAVFAPNPDHVIRVIAQREAAAGAGARGDDAATPEGGMVASSQTGHVLVSADFNGCIKVFVHKAKPKHSSLPASALA